MSVGSAPSRRGDPAPAVALGLRANWRQFWLLVLVNAFVGAMVGMERSILPRIAEQEFGLAAERRALVHRRLRRRQGADQLLRRPAVGPHRPQARPRRPAGSSRLPVPFLLMWAPELDLDRSSRTCCSGISQGLTWSTTVIMKIDLVGPEAARPRDGPQRVRRLPRGGAGGARHRLHRGRATACGPSRSTWGSASSRSGSRLSALLVRETHGTTSTHEAKLARRAAAPRARRRRARCSARRRCRDRDLSSVSQAGLVNNLNDGMAWGLFPLFFAAAGHGARRRSASLAAHLSGDVGHRAAL